MLKIDSIENGIVIDHIKAGMAMKIYSYLELEKLEGKIAIITNAKSQKCGKKDIIKIENEINLNLDALAVLAPDATVITIKNSKVITKQKLELPKRVANVIKCKNPRCITTEESQIDQIFELTDREKGIYKCIYCEKQAD